MAIAKAECTCSICGEKFEVRAHKANSRETASFEKWAVENITICDDCAKARRDAAHAKENEAAAQSAIENKYPALTGTDKQVAWATTIRGKAMETLHAYCAERLPRYSWICYQEEAFSRVLLSHTGASWWIDRRGCVESVNGVSHLIYEYDRDSYNDVMATVKALKAGEMTLEVAMAEFAEKPAEKPVEKPVRPEAVPEERKHDGSVDIHFDGEKVTAKYAKDETFREIVKAMGFQWSDSWTRTVTEMTGTAGNIAAELGSRLLNKGFAVRFDDQETLDRAVSGDYTPMCRRWIKNVSEGFGIVWEKNEEIYHAAKTLPGARYEFGIIKVPERSWAAVVDFAARYGFRITARAQEKLDTLSSAAKPVTPAPSKEAEYNETNVLESSREVLPDLRDDQ